MEKADQNTQCSSKGAFDAASLLAPSSPVFGHQMPVPANAPLFHLAHTPSAFSVLSQTTSLSSHSPSPLSINSKICSQIGTDAHSSFSSSIPGCSTAGTHAHENLGSELNDTVSLKHGSSSSSLHCHMAQPRRIVEEMLGHLYARPPSAEIKTELPVSGIHNTSQTIRTPTLVSSPPLISGNKLLRVKTNSIIKETINSGKISEKQMLDLSESNNSVSTNTSIKNSSGKKRSSETSTDSLNMSKTSLNSLHNLNNKIKQKFDDSSISVSSQNGIQVKNKELKKHHKQKKFTNKDSGSDTDIQSNDSSSSSGSAENSSSSESGSDSSNSDSSDDGEEEDEFDEEEDDDDDEKRRKNLKELRKQQQELRKKVQELKQASQEAQAHKAENHAKKCHGTKNSSFGTGVSLIASSDVTLPSPAHSGSSILFSGSPCKVTSGNQEAEMSVAPLDLCIKKQDSPADSTTILENQNEVFSSKSSNAKSTHSRKKNSNKSKKIEKSLDILTNIKEENAFESGLENSDTDDTEQSAAGSTTGNLCISSSNRGTKRQFLDELDGPQKKKRVLPDEKDIRIPLEYGWRRQTKIRCFSRSGVRGEVTYFAPCGKKLRNYPEVVRYLQRHGITDISRENFTFSTKINVGEFVEHSQGGHDDYLMISEQEVIARIEEVRARKGRLGVQGRRFRTVDEEEEQISQWEETQSTEKQVEETKRQKEHQRLTKQQERYDRLEQLRLERELRAQQMLEARRKRQEELERQRCEEALQKAQERERRRQHMLLVRALEARKKQEERERKREEILYEKRLNKEKKLEQRRLELQMIREMKKPIEDMCLKDNNPLPTLNRIPGVKLAGKAFADIMMVFEFLHNFGDTLGFDMENLPTLNTLQMALLNHSEKTEEELLSVVHHLLVCVISDPGVPHCPDAVSILGQHLRDVDITNSSVSEVLRLYVTAQNKNSEMYHWLNQRPFLALNPMQKAEILAFLCNELLCSRAVIRQIDTNIESVNSLRKDKWLIEGDLRKLKCIQQKRVHTNYIKQSVADDIKGQDVTTQKNIINNKNKNIGNISKIKTKTTRSKRSKDTETEENDIGGNESGNDTDDIQEIGHLSEVEIEYTALTNDELSRKIDKLNKQQTQYQNKLTRACHTIRATTFGQDRYKRRYWVLPFSGGIFVEGQESADPDDEKIKTESSKEINETIDIGDDKMIVVDKDIKMDLSSTHSFNENELEDKSNTENLTVEKIKNTDSEKVVNNRETKDVNSTETELNLSTEWIDHKTCTSPKQNDIFSPFTNQYIKSGNIEKMVASKLNSSSLESDKISNSLISGDQNWFLQSPFFASILAGSMLFNGPLIHNRELNGSYFNFPKDDLSLQDNSFGNFLGFPSGLLSEQIVKNSENLSNQSKPWFSILPRMPCEHNSAISAFNSEEKKSSETQISNHLNSISPIASTSNNSTKHNGTHLPLFQHSSATNIGSNPNHATAAAIANLHVELMNGLPSSFFMHPFLSPQSFGPTYQNDPSISNAPNSVTSCITNINNSTSVTSNINNTSNSLQITNSEILANFGLPNLPPASSTPSSIPTPSATPGPSHGSAPSSQRETPSPSFCRKYFVDKQDQFEEPQPIPLELRRGWWRITDPEQLKTLLNALHPRGIREKMLKKQLQKLFNYACLSCSKENREATDLEIIELDREISQKVGGTPDANNDDEWFSDVALRIDLAILEHVESMEEKVASASMQIKGWKIHDKLSNDPTITFYPACDSSAHYSSLQEVENNENDRLELIDKNSDTNSIINKKDENDNTDEAEINDDSEKKIEDDDNDENLKDVEKKTKDIKRIIDNNTEQKSFNPVEVAKERLLLLEAAIERRYLRAPLGTSSSELKLCPTSSGKSQNTDEKDDDDIPVGLLRWRDSVNKCKTAAQLAMCINLLETCVAWDKSIMRASCQFCHNGDNEEMLLLCDGCDKGYHTYCFKPKMESIPDGDWYCYECLSKVTGEQVCVLCGKKGKLLSCDACPKTFHLNCLEPPLSKMPKGKWSCPSCNHNKPKKTYKHKPKDKEKEKDIGKDHKDNSSKKSESSKSKNSDKRDKNKHNKDLSVCSILLNELEKHEDAWPFLLPVNTKQFPTYRKIIKKPMDLTTMKNKLEGGMYKSRDEIASDARLIFDNCETFNEDDSPVGQAGHRMRAFFECRWMELTNT